MTSHQYEELCRIFLAEQLRTSTDKILSVEFPNPSCPGQPEFAHQIDLYWQVEDNLSKFVIIANAKWRQPPGHVELDEVLLLLKVRDQIGAHKAMLLTNTGYSQGARAAAVAGGVALHVVCPVLKPRSLHRNDPVIIREQLQRLRENSGPLPLYVHQVVHKGLGLGRTQAEGLEPSAGPSSPDPSGSAAGQALFAGSSAGSSFTYVNKMMGSGETQIPCERVWPSPPKTPSSNEFRFRTK